MKTSELAELIKSRRSIRSWQDKPVSENLLCEAIGLATYAPNGGNQQNWHFYVILNPDVIKCIADSVQTTADYIASWTEAAKFGEATTRMLQRSGWFRSAPAAIAVVAKQYQSPLEQLSAAREKIDAKAR